MKKYIPLLLVCALLCGCAANSAPQVSTGAAEPTSPPETIGAAPEIVETADEEIPFLSRFNTETAVVLSDQGITVNGGGETDAVYTSSDIIYYAFMDTYESGNPYGEGTLSDRHTDDEAAAHTVVNITAPGAYRISGKLSAGQIRVDLGDGADADPNAVVELILDGADITCTVAPAILFLNVYECDGGWSTETASPNVDTTDAGAVLVLAQDSENTVTGSHVAKIYKDAEGEKKLWKQDGAIYSYMSMNVYGPGALDVTADCEGLDTELHLTIYGGSIAIRSGNDGINTNEDGVSVTTINGGSLHIIAGLGDEGDGIDSNGYLVINGGTVVASANPAGDAGLDSDMGSYVNGGTVIALGSTMDWAESDSEQVTMNLQFAGYQSSGSAIVVKRQDGAVVFAYDPSEDEVLGENIRQYQGAVISCPQFQVDQSYEVWLDGAVTGTEVGGVYRVTTISAYEGGTQMMYTGTDVGKGGSRGGFGDLGGSEGSQRPEGEMKGSKDLQDREKPEGETRPEGEVWPEGETRPEGEAWPEGETRSQGDFGSRSQGGMQPGAAAPTGTGNTLFYMLDKVNAFSGVTAVVGESA